MRFLIIVPAFQTMKRSFIIITIIIIIIMIIIIIIITIIIIIIIIIIIKSTISLTARAQSSELKG